MKRAVTPCACSFATSTHIWSNIGFFGTLSLIWMYGEPFAFVPRCTAAIIMSVTAGLCVCGLSRVHIGLSETYCGPLYWV